MDCGVVLFLGGLEAFEQRCKFQLTQQVGELLVVGRLDPIGLGMEFHRTLDVDGRQFPAEARIVRLFGEEGLHARRRDLVEAGEQFVDRPELRDEFHRCFLADPFDPRNVVAAIAHETHHFDHTCGLHPELRDTLCLGGPFVFHGVVDTDMRRHELQHVFVTGDNDDVVPGLLCLPG